MSVETRTGGPVPQDVAPLVVDIKGLSKLLQRSAASLRRDEAYGRLPAGIRIGRSKRWRVEEIRAWVAAGAPPPTSQTTPPS
jgi:predicted DNA-binding transcriptional regulator AlpA